MVKLLYKKCWEYAGGQGPSWAAQLSLTRHPQLFRQALPEDVSTSNALLHADIHHWHKGADVQGPHARMFTWGRGRNQDWSPEEQADKEG